MLLVHLLSPDAFSRLQIRTFYRQDWRTNPRILECAVNISGYLPRTLTREQWEQAQLQAQEGVRQAETRHGGCSCMTVNDGSLGTVPLWHLSSMPNSPNNRCESLYAIHTP